MELILTFYWICGLGTSFILIYNILRLLNIKSQYETATNFISCIYQLVIVNWSIYNIYNENDNYLIDYSMLGYYMYDIITCIIAPYDCTFYTIHHGIAIYMISTSYFYGYSPYIYRNLLYLLMESSASMANSMNIVKIHYPEKLYNYQIITYSVFGITRVIIFPICIINYMKEVYTPIWYHKVDIILLSIIYISSISFVINSK